MSAASKIEWTDATWNPVVGCSLVSPGCTNCYAMRQAHRLAANPRTPHYRGTTETVKGKPVWTGKVAAAPDRVWEQPLRWRKPRRVFVNSMGDLFHEGVDDLDIARAFAVMLCCPEHTFQVLTKRSERMREYMANPDRRVIDTFVEEIAFEQSDPHARLSDDLRATAPDVIYIYDDDAWPPPNVWLGVSAEDRDRTKRLHDLLRTLAAKRFVSFEPLLGAIDATSIELEDGDCLNALTGELHAKESGCIVEEWEHGGIDWVIAGGESGPGARPAHPDWFRSIRDQCAAAGVPFFFKQWGAWLGTYPSDRKPEGDPRCHEWNGGVTAWRVGKAAAGRELDGRTHDAMPGIADV